MRTRRTIGIPLDVSDTGAQGRAPSGWVVRTLLPIATEGLFVGESRVTPEPLVRTLALLSA